MAKSVKKDGYSFTILPAKTPDEAVASICLPVAINAMTLYELKKEKYPSTADKFDETVVALALYNEICMKLSNVKMKVHKVSCGCPSSAEFMVSVTCDRTFTSVRKCLRAMVKSLSANFSGRYKEICKSVGVKPSTEAFDYACGLFAKAVKGVSFAIGGKIKPTDEAIGKLTTAIASKVPTPKECAKGASRKIEVEKTDPQMESVAVKGTSAVVAKLMFKEKIKEIKMTMIDGKLHVSKKHAKNAEEMIKKMFKAYETLQKSRLKVDFVPTIVYYGLKCAILSPSNM